MTSYVAQANTGADALATTRAVTKPGGVAAGDVGVFWLVRWSDAASFPAVTPPSGAVLRGTITNGTEQTLCYLHRVNAETTFTYSWTGSRWSALSTLFFSGVDPALDLSAAPFQSATGSGTAVTTLTVTTVDAAALAWNVSTIATSGVTHTPPTSFTEVADVSPWASAYLISPGTGSQSAAGAVNSPTAQWAAGLVALAPAASGVALGTAAATETAQPLAGGKGAALGTADETGTAQPLVAAKSFALGVASATEMAQPLAGGKAATLAPAAQSDTAQPLTGGKTTALGVTTEIEEAQPLTGSKATTLGTAEETATAQPFTGTKNAELTPAAEQDTAHPVTGSKTAALGIATATETAQPLTGSTAATAALGTATANEAALPLTGSKTATLGTAVEDDTARPLTTPSTTVRSAERTYQIPAESRRLTVAAEHRTLTVR